MEPGMQPDMPQISRFLLGWYDRNRRSFPWRAGAADAADPYRVWLSEIMLQQTGTATVAPYFVRFTTRWPDVHALAAAPIDEVLREWAGLGYYARARNLHKCAALVSSQMKGEFPRDPDSLRELPGIGPYTAAAVAAIAFDQPGPVLDGNIERVLSRVLALAQPLKQSRPELRQASQALTACGRAGDTAQAMMDLGALICRPRAPDCAACPLTARCAAHQQGIAETLPLKPQKRKSPTRRGAVFWLQRRDGAVLLRRRPERGLLGGMMEFPGTPWAPETPDYREHAPARCAWRVLPGTVRHIFTHFRLELTVYAGICGGMKTAEGVWAPPETLGDYALPGVMRKVAHHVATHGTGTAP
jgi:A/G-specific adenine glycosylase